MATKPVTLPNIWDSVGVYATGPFIGSISIVDPGAGIAGEGPRPGSLFPTAARMINALRRQGERLTAQIAVLSGRVVDDRPPAKSA